MFRLVQLTTTTNACYAPDIDHTNVRVQADVVTWLQWLRKVPTPYTLHLTPYILNPNLKPKRRGIMAPVAPQGT